MPAGPCVRPYGADRPTTSSRVYAAASNPFGLGLMALGLAAWWELFVGFCHVWQGGVGYKALAVYLVLPFAPMLVHLVAQPIRRLKAARRPVGVHVGFDGGLERMDDGQAVDGPIH
jgi:hypothetical protein